MQKKFPIRISSLIRSRLSGGLAGARKDIGGLEFEELREFEPGDPLTAINHEISLRQGREMVVMRMPDRRAELILLVDTTPSMVFGAEGEKKLDQAEALLIAASHVAREYQARLSIRYASVKAGKNYLSELPVRQVSERGIQKEFAQFTQMAFGRAGQSTFDVKRALQELTREGKRRTLAVVIVSDFLYPADYAEELEKLKADRHTIIGAATLNSAEIALPSLSFGALRVRDSETGVSALLARSPEHFFDAHMALWKTLRLPLEVVQPQGDQP
jgi:uncharacterized protein (DUF58 family)